MPSQYHIFLLLLRFGLNLHIVVLFLDFICGKMVFMELYIDDCNGVLYLVTHQLGILLCSLSEGETIKI